MCRRKKIRMKALLRDQWGRDPRELAAAYMTRDRLPYIRMYHDICAEKGVDEITWSDLEMDEVFLRINHTRSFVGEQVLYHRLHEPEVPDALEHFEQLVSAFSADEEGGHMKISEAAQMTGLDISTIRFYERKGLIKPSRSEGSTWDKRLRSGQAGSFGAFSLLRRSLTSC